MLMAARSRSTGASQIGPADRAGVKEMAAKWVYALR
jgi:hypothetical protein